MTQKTMKAIIAPFILVLIPICGNIRMYYSLQIWILVIMGIVAAILQPNYSLATNKNNPLDKGTESQIIWSVFLTQLLAVLEAAYLRFPGSVTWNIITSLAFIAMLAGLALRTWSIKTLGKYFTMQLAIQQEHKIIRQGPYQYLRHPSYAGAFLTYLGTIVFFHSWYSLLIALVVLPIAWIRRMHYEEKMLIAEFGDEYTAYCKSVKRILPGVW